MKLPTSAGWAIPVLAPLGAALVLAGAASARPPLPCPPRGQAVIAEDATMRVYRPKLTARDESERPVIACVVGSRTRMTLIPATVPRRLHGPRGPGNLTRIALAGNVVAYVTSQLTGVDTSATQITVADVARRTILRTVAVDAGLVFSSGPSALDVTPRGGLAWILETAPRGRRPGQATVLAAARTGPIVTLDEGPGIEPQSLYLSGETVDWVDGGATRSAPLPSTAPPLR